ncbi:MAG: GntR family transcriptional regulator [Gammaproteobacteria bacterium]|nr:GntR family transcriptional regulator [Gammaproteobacteria bacterium]QOJ31969.1 MAG: GntR family transcriptional regulator [Gammaproteobacteria bacterium]
MVARKGELIDHAIKSPRYIQVYSTVRDWIYQGSYKPGSRLPTEEELCRLFKVSRITTRKAVDMLVDEGLVLRQPGRGTFVVEDLADAPVIGEMDQLLRKVERLGKTSRVAQAEVTEIEADPETAHDLQLLPGARVQRASHVRLSDRNPVGYVITYVPSTLKVRFDLRELNESPMLNLLERKGVDIAAADQVISATLADARLASLLNTTVGAPLVHIRLVVFDSQRRPVERLVAWYRGDHYHHHVHLTRKAR